MPELSFETEIQASADEVFALIADLRGYDRWLPRSGEFQGTTAISDGPIGAGTPYVEVASSGVRHGTVTEFEPPARIAFHQPMTLKPRLAGVVDIVAAYALTPRGDSAVHVRRDLTLDLPPALKAAQPLVLRRFRRENERTLAALKVAAERGPAA